MTDDSTNHEPVPDSALDRRQRYVAFCVIGALLLLAIASLPWPGSSSEDSAARFVDPEPGTEEFGPYDAPEDDGEIEIVEKGYTPIKDVAGEDQVSWGAILSNSSEVSVAQVTLELRILDEDGESLNQKHGDYALNPAVSEILPGERAGIGNVIYMDGPGAAEFEMRVAEVQWWPLDDPTSQFAELTVSELSTEWINQGKDVPYWGEDEIGSYVDERGDLRIDFRLDSGYDHLIEPGAAVIFRDEDGEIVGGAPPDDINIYATAPPGWSEQYIVVKYGPPEDIDEDAIEVYVYTSNIL